MRFPAHHRIRKAEEFERAFALGVRVHDRQMTLWIVRNELSWTRLGLAVGRKHGNAVRRNRLKRLLRETFRLSYPRLPAGLDIVCVPRGGAEITLPENIELFLRLVGRALRKLPPE